MAYGSIILEDKSNLQSYTFGQEASDVMTINERIQRVCIYLSEHDRFGNQPLYLEVLEVLQREGATGATALRGLAGFGPGYRTRTAGYIDLREHPPVVIEWIDRAERIEQLLSQLDDILPDALITVEDIQVYRAMLRGTGPFAGDQSVGDYMRPVLHTVPVTASLEAVLAILLGLEQTTVPVVDNQYHVVGIVTEQDLVQRAGLRLPFRLLRVLSDSERATLLTPLVGQPVTAVMNNEPRSVYLGAALPQALMFLLEWNYDQIPVLERSGKLAGLLGRSDVLRAAVTRSDLSTGAVRNAEPPTLVHLVMQRSVPYILNSEALVSALQQLATTPDYSLLVVDAAGRVQGQLRAERVLPHLDPAERAVFLAVLQRRVAADRADLPGVDRDFHFLIERDPLTVMPNESIYHAARRLLEQGQDRAPVVNEDSILQGMLSQAGVLRALFQASE